MCKFYAIDFLFEIKENIKDFKIVKKKLVHFLTEVRTFANFIFICYNGYKWKK